MNRPASSENVDRKLTPNELDQSDEALKAADMTYAGEAAAGARAGAPECAGETPQSVEPCAPDGRSAERYAG